MNVSVSVVVWGCRLLLTAPLLSAQAATYYVATTGSDSNPGTSVQPFRTISHADRLAGPGSSIIVEPGTYTDYQRNWGLHLHSSGTVFQPIVFHSLVRGAAIIDGQNATDRNVGIYLDGDYNIVDGFEIKNGPNTGISIWGNGNQILNCEVDHNGNPAYTGTDGRCGIYEDQVSDNVFAGNSIHDNGRTGGSKLDHGLYLCGQNDVVINNVSFRNDGSGLQIAGYTTVSGMTVYNNVFAWNGYDGIIVWMNMNGVDIKNNILYNNGIYGIHFFAATGSGVVIDHNLVYGNGTDNYDSPTNGDGTVSVTQGTTISSDPQFANETESGFDAHLTSDSPAIGAGYDFYWLFPADLAGNIRPPSGAWDLGAYVFTDIMTLGLPEVNVITSTNAARVGLSSGAFTIMRSGSTDSALTVNYSLSGTATNGTDYDPVSASVIIPAGAGSVTIPIVPLPSASYVGAKLAVLTLSPDPAYATGLAGSAGVVIAGNSLSCSLNVSPTGRLITWPSEAGRIYRVLSKHNLSDSGWTDLSGPITATGTTTSYNDSTAGQQASCFYMVFVTD